MVQGYTQQNSGSEGGWTAFPGSRTAEEGIPSAGATGDRSYISRPYTCGTSYDQWAACLSEESKLSGVEAADSKHSIASMDVSMKSNTFALQNIKERLWQAAKILKGYWSFTTRSQRQVEYQLFLSVKRMVSFTLSLRGGTRTVIR